MQSACIRRRKIHGASQASEWIFKENNTDSEPGEFDLHGLYVKEAIHFTERAIQEARARGDSQVNLIVGASVRVVNVHPGLSDLLFPPRDR